jgi:hypothetical protein
MLLVKQIKDMRQRPRGRAIGIPRQSSAQGIERAPVLQQQRGGDGRVASIGVEERAMLGRRQKNFSRLLAGIVKEANASGVGQAAMLELDNEMRAPVRQAAAL